MGEVVWTSMWVGFIVACAGFALVLVAAVSLVRKRHPDYSRNWKDYSFGYEKEESAERG